MDELRYQDTLERCSLVKDLELLPHGDMTQIRERGVNLSGGQKQRIQLARALYQDADIYLLDDPFSVVDAQTATSLFNEYVIEALSSKTVLLVTHQVDFLPGFHCCLLMSDGEILRAGQYDELLASSPEFMDLVNAHKETAGTKNMAEVSADLSIVDLDVPFSFFFVLGSTSNAYSNLGVLAVLTWQVLLVCIPVIYLAIRLQRYYFETAKELMRLNGTTKSLVANHLAESVAGATTIRAFKEEDRFFAKTLRLIDINASPFFHNFSANEWLIQRLEILSACVLSTAALCIVLLPTGTFSPGKRLSFSGYSSQRIKLVRGP